MILRKEIFDIAKKNFDRKLSNNWYQHKHHGFLCSTFFFSNSEGTGMGQVSSGRPWDLD